MTELTVKTASTSYPVYVGSGLLSNAGTLLSLARRVFILTDSGVPCAYSTAVKEQCRTATVYTLPQGESSKSFASLEKVLAAMLSFGMTRADALVAVGGGVVGDVGGLCASLYMRGIDFYNVPTTLLAQADSSVGGKTAVDFCGVKNVVGTFYQPRAVIVDPSLLATLPQRQTAAGMAEIIKMAATSDASLFSMLERENPYASLDTVLPRALQIKIGVVEKDEKEGGLRRILNFGHTLGHGIESAQKGALLHGECISLGMLPMASPEARARIAALCEKVGLPVSFAGVDTEAALSFVAHDKKAKEGGVACVFVDKIGECEIKTLSLSQFDTLVKEALR